MLLNSRNKQDTAFNGQLKNPPKIMCTQTFPTVIQSRRKIVLPQMEAFALDSFLFPTQLLCLTFLAIILRGFGSCAGSLGTVYSLI